MHPEKPPSADRPDSLEARLRALPLPPVPAGLEARLLGAIPVQVPGEHSVRVRRSVWIAAACALAAACLLVVLFGRGREGDNPAPTNANHQVSDHGPPRAPAESVSPRLLQARRDLEETQVPAFTWPLEQTSSTRLSISIQDGLLD
jgi:hypothetical protein